jgi:hypothetical protein
LIHLKLNSDLPVNRSEGWLKRQDANRNNTGIRQEPGRRQPMTNTSLSEFAGRLRAKSRITFADVQRLRRDVLPDGITSREDTELLISLDRDVSRSNPEWESWLVAMVVDFVVWTERPTGVVDEDTAFWLAATLNCEGARATKTGRLIAREVVQEAEAFENEALTALASTFATRKSRTTSETGAPCSLAA